MFENYSLADLLANLKKKKKWNVIAVFVLFDKILTKIAIFLIKIYQKTLSPDKGILSFYFKGKICSHEPHCSEYSIRTLKRY